MIKPKRVLFLFIILGVITLPACSYLILREGYDISKKDYDICDLKIEIKPWIDESELEYLGMIQITETGYTLKCDKADAMGILEGEACAIDADVVWGVRRAIPNLQSPLLRVQCQDLPLQAVRIPLIPISVFQDLFSLY